ncbi:glycosyltransferase family 2 protein [Micromonospora sp. BRA006-A]|nr:glycosyltransferase family 2 protein [Micromonospora sp. BRA006-A]
MVVVDGSAPELFARHADAWRGLVRHMPPDPALRGPSKVLGVLTGVALARHEHVVIADDDVRYDRAALCAVHQLLDGVDLVRPQNHFDPLPWHAWWTPAGRCWPACSAATGRARSGCGEARSWRWAATTPTCSSRTWSCSGPCARTAAAPPPRRGCTCGGSALRRALPRQRVRQAYDETARPVWMLAALAVLPATAVAPPPAGPVLLRAGLATVAVAELGRRRPAVPGLSAHTSLAAPAWVLERGLCAWLAVAGGCAAGCPTRAAGCGRRPTPQGSCAGGMTRHRPDDLVLWVETGAVPCRCALRGGKALLSPGR